MEVTLHRIAPPVTYDMEAKTMTYGGKTLNHEEWLAWVDRNNKMWDRLSPSPHHSNPEPHGSRFVVENLAQINKIKRGHIRRAPRFLRWFFDFVITKEHLDRD